MMLERLVRLVKRAVPLGPAADPTAAPPAAPGGRRSISARRLEGELATLILGGDIDGEVAPRVRERLSSLIEGGATRVLVDCARVLFFDVEGIGAILAEAPRLRAAGGDL